MPIFPKPRAWTPCRRGDFAGRTTPGQRRVSAGPGRPGRRGRPPAAGSSRCPGRRSGEGPWHSWPSAWSGAARTTCAIPSATCTGPSSAWNVRAVLPGAERRRSRFAPPAAAALADPLAKGRPSRRAVADGPPPSLVRNVFSPRIAARGRPEAKQRSASVSGRSKRSRSRSGSIPACGKLYGRRAEIYRSQGQFELAIADYTRQIELGAEVSQAHLARGICYRMTGDQEKALEDFHEAVWRRPRWTEAIIARAWTHFAVGKADQALDDAALAVELEPDEPKWLLARARLLAASAGSTRRWPTWIARCRSIRTIPKRCSSAQRLPRSPLRAGAGQGRF